MTKLSINFNYEKKFKGELHSIRELLDSQGFKAYYITFTSSAMKKLHPKYDVFEDAIPGRTKKEAEGILRKVYPGARNVKFEIVRKVDNLGSKGYDIAIDVLFGRFYK
jgi:hypothetical protein